MPLNECLKAVTHRQYLTWMAWVQESWNQPERTDVYLMQIACEIRRVLSRKPNSIQLNQFKIKFEDSGKKSTSLPLGVDHEKQKIAEHSRSLWLSRVRQTGKRPP